MSRLLYFGLGVLVGAGAATYGPALSRNARPLVKEAIKAALQIAQGARVQGTGLIEMLEDLYAEAIAEAQAAPVPRARKRRPARARKQAATRRPATGRAKAAEPVAEHA
jgi:hypothetical protein